MCRRMRKVSFWVFLKKLGGCAMEGSRVLMVYCYLTAPEPKPKKNRELKTEILPVTVTQPTAAAARSNTLNLKNAPS